MTCIVCRLKPYCFSLAVSCSVRLELGTRNSKALFQPGFTKIRSVPAQKHPVCAVEYVNIDLISG
jgi:hypothetical protein